MAEDTAATRTPDPDQLTRFKNLMADARESRSEANASAGDAREILKGLGFQSASIAMFKRLSDMGKETAEATFAELCQLLNADPDFDFGSAQPDMFAHAQVKAIKGKKASENGAFVRAQEHLGTAERHDDAPAAA